MDLDPTYLLVALLVGLIGMGLMMFGKKMGDLRALIVGGVLSAETIFLQSAGWLILGALITLGGFYAWRKFLPA